MFLYNTQGKLERFEPEITKTTAKTTTSPFVIPKEDTKTSSVNTQQPVLSPQEDSKTTRDLLSKFQQLPTSMQNTMKNSMGTDTMGLMRQLQDRIIEERDEQDKQMQIVKRERDWITTVAQEKLEYDIIEQEQILMTMEKQTQKPKPVQNLSVEVTCNIANSRDETDLKTRCGKCCQEENRILDRKAVVDKSKNKCSCFKMITEREVDKDLIFQQAYLENTGTTSGVYKSSITTADECRDACLRDNTCSYNLFTKDGLCYLANANWRKGVKQERIGNIIDYKILPPSIESVTSARYVLSDASAAVLKNSRGSNNVKMKVVKPISQVNCAQLCTNDNTCKYASASSSMDCEMATFPIENASLVSDVNSITYVP